MLKILTPNGYLKLGTNIEIPLKITNPLFNDKGSHSLPFTVPLKPNRALLGFPDSLNNKNAIGAYVDCTIEHTNFFEKGTLKILDISDREIELSLTTREGAFWEWAKATKLRRIYTRPDKEINFVNERENYFNNIWPNVEMAFFPVATLFLSLDNFTETESWNPWSYRKLGISEYVLTNNPSDLFRNDYADFANGGDVSGNITGFLYLNEILTWLSYTAGYGIKQNFLSSTEELRRIVVLNNSGFAYYKEVNYSLLLPNVTVMDFIDAVEKAFGCMFFVNNRREMNIISIKSIINSKNNQNLNASIKIKTPHTPTSIGIKAERLSSPYTTVLERAVEGTFLSLETKNESLVDGKVYQTNSTPDYINYPKKWVFCVATQTYFIMDWHQNENYEYKATCIHSNYHELKASENYDVKNIDCHFKLAPMVPLTCRQFYKNPNNAYFDISLIAPFFPEWPAEFSYDDNIFSVNNQESPISFAFYRGRIEHVDFPEELFGITEFDLPIGSTDIYKKDGTVINGASIAMRIVKNNGIYENFYRELEQLYLKSLNKIIIENLNPNEILNSSIAGVFNVAGIFILFDEIELTLTSHRVILDSATGFTLKPYNKT